MIFLYIKWQPLELCTTSENFAGVGRVEGSGVEGRAGQGAQLLGWCIMITVRHFQAVPSVERSCIPQMGWGERTLRTRDVLVYPHYSKAWSGGVLCPS